MEFLFLTGDSEMGSWVLAAFELFLRNGYSETWLLTFIAGVEVSTETAFERLHQSDFSEIFEF